MLFFMRLAVTSMALGSNKSKFLRGCLFYVYPLFDSILVSENRSCPLFFGALSDTWHSLQSPRHMDTPVRSICMRLYVVNIDRIPQAR